MIAAGAIVLENTKIESGSLYAGIPAKKIKDLDRILIEGQIMRIANAYPMYASWYDEK
jgi:gamma-carbonic anhydrase